MYTAEGRAKNNTRLIWKACVQTRKASPKARSPYIICLQDEEANKLLSYTLRTKHANCPCKPTLQDQVDLLKEWTFTPLTAMPMET